MDFAERAVHVHWIDVTVIVSYLASLLLIGIYHARRQTSMEQYFLANRTMTWLPIGLSLMAALSSGTDYIVQPSAMIQYGPLILAGPFSWFFLYPYVFYITLPFYRKLHIFSAYEYLEGRFDGKVRTLAAVIFVVGQSMLCGMAIYVPCMAMAAAMRREELLLPMIVGIGVLVTLYTMLGGIKGIVWVNVSQFIVMFTGLAATVIIILIKVPGGWGAFYENISQVGFKIKELEYPAPPDAGTVATLFYHVREYFVVPMTATGILWVTALGRFNIYTTNQVMIQRFETTRSIKDARQGFFITAISSFLWTGVLSLLGVFLYTYYTQHGPMPEYFRANTDRVLPVFMADAFPIGMTGLVIAAIWAAALSGFDGLLNSMSTITMVDFVNRLFLKLEPGSAEDTPAMQRAQVLLSRIFTIMFGVIAIILASNMHRLGTLVEIGLKIIGCISGPMFAMYLLGMFTKRTTPTGVFWGGICGTVVAFYGMLWTSPALVGPTGPLRFLGGFFPDPEFYRAISPMWIGLMGLLATILSATLLSLVTERKEDAAEWTWLMVTRREGND